MEMVNFKISNHKAFFKKALLLTVFSSFSFNNVYAGKFREIPIEDEYSSTSKVILQYDDDEGRREAGSTVEIGKIKNVINDLNSSIETNIKKGNIIVGVDFSETDLINEELGKIVDLLSSKLKTINYLNLSDTHTNALEIDKNTTKKITSLLGYSDKTIQDLATSSTKDMFFYMPLAEYYKK